MSPEQFDVVIVGAGIAGCATARALALADPQRRRRILLVDRYRDSHPRFSGELIHPRGAQVLDNLGFYGPLRKAGALDVDGFVVFESADGPPVDLPYARIPDQRPRGLAVHHKVLIRVMRTVLADVSQVELRAGWLVDALVRERDGTVAGVQLKGPDGPVTVMADLVVGADGKGSTVRRLAGGPDKRETIGFTLGIELRNAALPAPTGAHVFLGAWGPILAYPILEDPDGTIRSRITFDLPLKLPVKGPQLAHYVLRTYVPFMPSPLARQTADAIAAHQGRWEIAPTVNLPAPGATRPGLALVGDAAGCSHPITASGMTMGLRDAETLGREAARRAYAPPGETWLDPASLRRYRTAHDRYVPTRQALADAIYEAFRGGHEGARAIRRALFAYWSSSESARRRSMALLSCVERRPHVFLGEYLRTARHAVGVSFRSRHAPHVAVEDRVRQMRGAVELARDNLGRVASVMWAQVRPGWLPRPEA